MGEKKDFLKEQLQELLEENLKVAQVNQEILKRLDHWVFWQKIGLVIKILIILVPIVLGIIYLPPLLKKVFTPYQELLNVSSVNILEQFKNTPTK